MLLPEPVGLNPGRAVYLVAEPELPAAHLLDPDPEPAGLNPGRAVHLVAELPAGLNPAVVAEAGGLQEGSEPARQTPGPAVLEAVHHLEPAGLQEGSDLLPAGLAASPPPPFWDRRHSSLLPLCVCLGEPKKIKKREPFRTWVSNQNPVRDRYIVLLSCRSSCGADLKA